MVGSCVPQLAQCRGALCACAHTMIWVVCYTCQCACGPSRALVHENVLTVSIDATTHTGQARPSPRTPNSSCTTCHRSRCRSGMRRCRPGSHSTVTRCPPQRARDTSHKSAPIATPRTWSTRRQYAPVSPFFWQSVSVRQHTTARAPPRHHTPAPPHASAARRGSLEGPARPRGTDDAPAHVGQQISSHVPWDVAPQNGASQWQKPFNCGRGPARSGAPVV